MSDIRTLDGKAYQPEKQQTILEPINSVVEMLEELLAKAKRGETRQIMYVTYNHDPTDEQYVKHGLAGVVEAQYIYEELGQLSMLEHYLKEGWEAALQGEEE